MERFSLAFLLVANLAWAADLTHLDHLCSDGTLPEKIVVKDRDRGEWQPKSGQPVFCSEHYPHYSCCPHDYQADFQQVNYEIQQYQCCVCQSKLTILDLSIPTVQGAIRICPSFEPPRQTIKSTASASR